MQRKPSRPTGRTGNQPSRTARGQAGARSAAYARPGARQRRRPTGIQGLLYRLRRFASTRRGLIALCGGAAALVALIVAVALLANRPGGDAEQRDVPAAAAVETATADATAQAGATAETAEDAAEPAATATASVLPNAYSFKVTPTGDSWKAGKYAPEPQGEGYLPVFRSAGRDDKVVAITVDDCFQTENLRQIIELADSVNGKLTIFPIGELLKREALQEVIKDAHAKGHEIENHTWSHDGLYNLSDEDLAIHIFDQDRAVDKVLGVNYKTHFLRPMGGDDRNDLRTHSYIRQLGYYGIAHWSASGNAGRETLIKTLNPGAVFLFHCTDRDLATLKGFIPYCESQGYRLVTLNEMFGYAENETELLTDDPVTRAVIPLEPYEKDYKTLQPTAYDYAAYEVQQALIEKGFLTGEPDGVYGAGTAECAARWQASEGYTADGVLTPEQQKKLLGVE